MFVVCCLLFVVVVVVCSLLFIVPVFIVNCQFMASLLLLLVTSSVYLKVVLSSLVFSAAALFACFCLLCFVVDAVS